MKNILLIIFITGFFACKKETTSSTEKTPAAVILNLSYGTDPLQKMDLYLPAGRIADTTKLIVMIHGGAWIAGDKTDFTGFVPRIQQLFPGYAIANINYRLASVIGNFFPVQENDVRSAVNFLIQKREEYLFSDKLVLFGASAGGHLAALQAYKYSSPAIKVVVDFFGPTEMVALYDSYTLPASRAGLQLLMGGTPATNPSMYFNSSPVNFVTAQSSPTIILHGDADDVVPLNQSVILKNKLQSMNVPHQLEIYPGMGHDNWPDPIMNNALSKIRTFVYAHINK
jgi:acetyl esterase/lipase